MKRLVIKLFVLVVLLIHFTGCKKRNTDVLYDRSYIDEIKTARQEISFFMARNFIPGATFAVSKEGKLIYSEGLGLASRDLEVPATRSTKFRIGEVSEVFTALLYHKLVQNNILHPDSAVQAYLPGFPEKEYKITLQNLVQHTSGIREPDYEEEEWPGINVNIKSATDKFKADSLLYPPGSFQMQSMFNYNLLGAVMEETTGKSFQYLIKKYVTDTLQLEHTQIDNPFATVQGRSDFYNHNFVAQVVNATFRDMRYRAPSEGFLSNAEDLVKFGNALLYSDYVTAEIKARMFEPVNVDMNMQGRLTNGWIIFQDNTGRQFYGRSGSVTGGSSVLLIFPDDKLVVACATNLTSSSEDFPIFQIAAHFLPEGVLGIQNQKKEETKGN